MSASRKMVGCVLMLAFPASLLAADSGKAMVYAHGAAWLNGAHVPSSSAIFTGDLLQTRFDSAANINAPGSSISIFGDSLVEFQGSSLKVQHGGVAVATSKGVETIAGEVHVAPASSAWTEFNVSDVNGTVKIAATKGDLVVTDDAGTTTLAQGQQTTRDDQSDQSAKPDASDNSGKKDTSGKKKPKKQEGAQPGATGGALNSQKAIIAGAAAVAVAGGLTAWLLVQHEDAVSPSKP